MDVTQARKQFSQVLELAAAGTTTVISKRGKDVAWVTPVPNAKEAVYQPKSPDTSSEAQEIQRRRDALLKSINARGAPK